MVGYADRPEESAHVLQDGWLRTGDLGEMDPEGYLRVIDRRDDLIVSGGENVYPAEVEAVLAGHPAVADAGVIGLPDRVWGQAVAALVKLRAGAAAPAEDLRAYCAERLARYKVPTRIWVVDDLPRAPSGKLIRRDLRARAERALDGIEQREGVEGKRG
jgi:O-succinylbenzoic acid--CoA ligase